MANEASLSAGVLTKSPDTPGVIIITTVTLALALTRIVATEKDAPSGSAHPAQPRDTQ